MITIIPALIIIFFAFFLHALTGFGGGLLSVPFLAFFYDIKTISPLINILGLAANLFIIHTFYKYIRVRILIPLVIGNIAGSLIGGYFLSIAENALLMRGLSILIILFSLNLLFNKKYAIKENAVLAVLAGGVSGFLSAIFAMGGPPLVLYLAGVLKEKKHLRATLLGFFIINGFTQVPVLAMNGLITKDVLMLALIGLPISFFASWVGHKVHISISESLYKKIIVSILIFSGLLLFFK